MGTPDGYIPYETVAMAHVEDDTTVVGFLGSLFPEATIGQLEKFKLFMAGVVHEGIMVGLELSSNTPMSEVQAYHLGIDEGYKRAMEDRTLTEGDE